MDIHEYEAHLSGMGLTIEIIKGRDGREYVVARGFELPGGSLRGTTCDIAIERYLGVPYVPPAAIHTNPALVPMGMNTPQRTQASDIGPDWQYWSRQFNHELTPRNLWAHILTVLCDERWPKK